MRKRKSAYLLATKDGIVEEGQFRLTDGSTVFAAEVHAIKEAISDALRKGLGEYDIISDSRAALQALYSLVESAFLCGALLSFLCLTTEQLPTLETW